MVIKSDAKDEQSDDEKEEWKYILGPQTHFPKFREQIAQLDMDAERLSGLISTKLDLKAKHASLRESHAAAMMSAAVFGFTIITIIFTPLSFGLTLFQLPIDMFAKKKIDSPYEKDPTRLYPYGYIGTYIGECIAHHGHDDSANTNSDNGSYIRNRGVYRDVACSGVRYERSKGTSLQSFFANQDWKERA